MNTEFLCSQYLMQEQGETQILCLPPGVQKVKTIELLFVLIVSVRDDLELDKTNIFLFWAHYKEEDPNIIKTFTYFAVESYSPFDLDFPDRF